MSPEYFHTHLTYGEADDYLGGLNRRYHHGYNQARMIKSIIGGLFAKNYTPETFPWEKAQEIATPPTKDELADILKDAKVWEKHLNGTK